MNSRTPPPRHAKNHNASSPDLFNDINSPEQIMGGETNDGDDEDQDEDEEDEDQEDEWDEEEIKEELSFRPLSRSLSSDTNILAHSPVNPFVTLSTKNEVLVSSIENEMDDNAIFIFHADNVTDKQTLVEDDEMAYPSTSPSPKVINGAKNGDFKMEEQESKKCEDELRWEDIQIIERIGIGGFAEVFSGKIIRIDGDYTERDEFDDDDDDEFESKVAIKKLINQNLTFSNLAEFSSEIEIMRKIKHPNITKFIGACTKSPHMCIVTELLEMSLFDLLHNTRLKISIEIELKIACGATKGVSHLHDNNIIHRDLKSANILLDKHFEPRITDFGLSRMKDQSTLTAGTGTFQWMAPEVIQGKKYDEKSDIYSLAIVFWEINTGLIPFISYRLNGIQASVAVVTQKKRPKIDSKLFKNRDNYNKWKTLIIKMWNQSAIKRPTAKPVINLLN